MPEEMSIKGEKVLEDKLRKLVDLFRSEKEVLVAYLFGSYARGLETLQSDVDIAILLSEVPEKALEYYLHLERRLAEVLENDVDLVFLNDAPPLLRYQVIKYGRLLFSRDERVRVMFEAKSLCEYLDFSRALRRYDECFMKRILA
ncbi:MAG: type VII toxin-antitoxin system MntA family adenylyltransferase antitoxin [Candidatus Nezhaarchaeales archaeon]